MGVGSVVSVGQILVSAFIRSIHSAPLFKSPQTSKQKLQRNLRAPELAFPYDKNIPTDPIQVVHGLPISISIGSKLFGPKIGTRLGYNSVFTVVMTMPKTSMYKNTNFMSRQYNVRLPRQILAMKSETVTVGMKKAPDNQLRFRVFSLDTGHHSGSCGAVNDVHFVFSQNSVVS
jgi:hypothetical protein